MNFIWSKLGYYSRARVHCVLQTSGSAAGYPELEQPIRACKDGYSLAYSLYIVQDAFLMHYSYRKVFQLNGSSCAK